MSDNVWMVGRPRPLLLPLAELEGKPPILKFYTAKFDNKEYDFKSARNAHAALSAKALQRREN